MQSFKKNFKLKGDYGENLIIQYLSAKNHIIVAKKFSTHFGEIDLITKSRTKHKSKSNKTLDSCIATKKLNSNVNYIEDFEYILNFYEIKFTSTNPYLKWKRFQKYRFLKAVKIFLSKNPKYVNYKISMQLVWLNKINSTKIKIIKYKNIELNYD